MTEMELTDEKLRADEWLRDVAMDVMLATEVEEAARILSAALERRAVSVKPLEWAQHPSGRDLWKAESLIGSYQASALADPQWQFDGDDGQRAHSYSASLDEAKSAAQADYEQRILSALTGSDSK